MKVAILHTDFRVYWPPRLKALNAFLIGKGHTLVVIEIAGKGSPYAFAGHTAIADFPAWIILFPDRRIEDVSSSEAGREVYRTLEELNPDVLLSGAIAFYSGSIASRWVANRNKPLVIFDNARLKDVPRNQLVNIIKGQFYRLADAVFCPAPSHDASFIFWGFKKEAIFYGLNCVDNTFFKKNSQLSTTNNFHFHLPARYFLTVGQHIRKKNLPLLLMAYRQYLNKTTNQPISLVITGGGEQNCLLRLIAGELIDKSIFFLPFLTQEQLVPVYSGSTAYILPSLYGETWGLTVNEAMVCGKPVVVSRQCGCCETLVHTDENGWNFNPNDKDELTEIFVKIGAMNQNDLTEMGKQSEEIISGWGLENFTKEIYHSINYAVNKNKKRHKTRLLIPRLLTLLWSGRYRVESPSKIKIIAPIKHMVILHTDLRIYWQARLEDLRRVLNQVEIRLDIIEIAGKGSPYAFENREERNDQLNWHILFPEMAIEKIASHDCQKAIRKKLNELNPDVVMAGALAFQSGSGALKWKALTGRPVIIFDDARPEDVKRSWLINTIKKIFYGNVDAVLCPAHSHTMGFTAWGLKDEEIFYGVDVVDNKLFEKNDTSKRKRSYIDIAPQPYLLAVGRQIEKKNWSGLLNAFINFKNEFPGSSLNLVFIGDGPLHQSLVDSAEAAKRADVVFLPFVQQDRLIKYYHQVRGLVLPSRYGETWGLVVNEAMAAGLPVLVSRECGCAQTLVSEGMNGWTFDPDNLEELSASIRKLDQLSAEQWEKMSQCSVETIQEWGLPRFTQGVLDALIYVSTKPKIKFQWLGKILLPFWNGRYRPV